MTTPENLKGAKNTPYRSVGISKSLLTPCRRVGLARKKSTPTSTIHSLLSSAPSISIEDSTINERKKLKPALKRNNGSDKVSIQSSHQTEEVVAAKENITYNENIKHKTTCDVVCNTKDSQLLKIVKNKKNKLESVGLPGGIAIINTVSTQKQRSDVDKTECMEYIHNPIKTHSEILKKSVSDNTPATKCASDNTRTTKTKLVKRLSMKKSLSLSQDELDSEDLLNTPKTSRSSLLSEEFSKDCALNFNDSDGSNELINIVGNKPRKKRAIMYSSDEEDFVSSQKQVKMESGSSNNLEMENWNMKIMEAKTRIKTKAAHLVDLKQAAVYKRLHNVEELKHLTVIWKKGCQEGLRHLLSKLQEHAHMEMHTLMKNLKIPPIITYNADNDIFT